MKTFLTIGMLAIVSFTLGCKTVTREQVNETSAPNAPSTPRVTWVGLLEGVDVDKIKWTVSEPQAALVDPAVIDKKLLTADNRKNLILVFGNTVHELPWTMVDTMVSDRTRWYILPNEAGARVSVESSEIGNIRWSVFESKIKGSSQWFIFPKGEQPAGQPETYPRIK